MRRRSTVGGALEMLSLPLPLIDWLIDLCDTSDLKQRLIDTWASISQNVIEEADSRWRKQLRACVKAKGHYFEHPLNENRLFSVPPPYTTASFSATNSLPMKTRYVSCHFRRNYLKANTVDKNGGTGKIENVRHFECVLIRFTQNYQNQSVHIDTTACQNWRVFLRHSILTY